MKIRADIITDVAYQILADGVDDALGKVQGDLDELVKAEFAIAIKRAVWTKQKRLVIDLVYPKA